MSSSEMLFINTKIDTLTELLAEIDEHDFATVSQVKGLIHTNLDIIKGIKEEYNDE